MPRLPNTKPNSVPVQSFQNGHFIYVSSSIDTRVKRLVSHYAYLSLELHAGGPQVRVKRIAVREQSVGARH